MEPERLEKLIQRYRYGDRDPELLRRLNEAAWEGFHDPWEVAPPLPEPPVEPPKQQALLPEETPAPDTVCPFDLAVLERALDARGWLYYKRKAPSPWLSVHFNYDFDLDLETRLSFSTQGKQRDILQFTWTGDRRTPAERFDRAFRLCNQWNSQKRWPRAYLEIPRREPEEAESSLGEEPASGQLTLDFHLPLSPGIHAALLDHVLEMLIDSGWGFWKMARKEYGL